MSNTNVNVMEKILNNLKNNWIWVLVFLGIAILPWLFSWKLNWWASGNGFAFGGLLKSIADMVSKNALDGVSSSIWATSSVSMPEFFQSLIALFFNIIGLLLTGFGIYKIFQIALKNED